jgi:oligopeptide/dipeptide ABC transporter ATP-binding protein
MYAGKIVECAPTREIFTRPLHPYTQGLLRARPGGPRGLQHKRLSEIKGMVPAATQFKDDCRFNQRCPLATDECRRSEPESKDYGNRHCAACFHTSAEGIHAWSEDN